MQIALISRAEFSNINQLIVRFRYFLRLAVCFAR